MSDADLTAWLRATINAEKATAQAAHGPNWNAEKRDVAYGDEWIMSALTQADAAHIARHDPQQTIDRCDTDLLLLDACAPPRVEVTGPGDIERQFVPGEGPPWAEPVLRLLAYGRRRRPGYNTDWAPEGMTA